MGLLLHLQSTQYMASVNGRMIRQKFDQNAQN